MSRPRKPANPFRYFHSSPDVIRLVVMMYVRFPLSLRNVEDLLFERGIDICHETVRLWWNRFGPLFAADIRRQRVRPDMRLRVTMPSKDVNALAARVKTQLPGGKVRIASQRQRLPCVLEPLGGRPSCCKRNQGCSWAPR